MTATQEDRIPKGAAGTRDALRNTLVADALVRSMAAGGQAQDVAVSPPS